MDDWDSASGKEVTMIGMNHDCMQRMSVFMAAATVFLTASLTSTAAETDIAAQAGVSDYIIQTVTEAYDTLPAEVKSALADHGTNIQILTNGDRIDGNDGITYLTATKDTDGYFIWNGGAEIYINGSIHDDEAQRAFIHEVGHWIDAYVGEIINLPGLSSDKVSDVSSNTADFMEIYDMEKDKSGWWSYFTTSTSEYYAESFRLYQTNPAELKANQPLTYEYIKNDISLIVE